MKKIFAAVILMIAITAGTIQPASAATSSLSTRTAYAKRLGDNCWKPYLATSNDTRVAYATRKAAYEVGKAYCSVVVYRYTHNYRDMYKQTAAVKTINGQYHYKAVIALKTQSRNLYYTQLGRHGFNYGPVARPSTGGFNSWLATSKAVVYN